MAFCANSWLCLKCWRTWFFWFLIKRKTIAVGSWASSKSSARARLLSFLSNCKCAPRSLREVKFQYPYCHTKDSKRFRIVSSITECMSRYQISMHQNLLFKRREFWRLPTSTVGIEISSIKKTGFLNCSRDRAHRRAV